MIVVRGHRPVESALLLLLLLDQAADSIERYAPIVPDDASAAVRVGQPGEDVRASALPDVRGVGVEHPFVVGLPVLRERLYDVGLGLVAVGLERAQDHPEAAVRHDRALERGLGLETDDDLVRTVDVPRTVRRDRAWNLGDVEHALLPLLEEELVEPFPDRERARGSGREERRVSLVRLVVLLDEVPDVDLLLPQARPEPAPRGLLRLRLGCLLCARSHEPLLGRFGSVRRGARRAPATARCAGRSSAPRWSGSPRPRPGCRASRCAAPSRR